MNRTITPISVDSPFLIRVIEIGDKYSKTLGFFPREAFKEQARKGLILGYIIENRYLAGYLLYRISKNIVTIVHLCIDEPYRGQG
jgi:ribosomal protein S18 acetylase RimI-like enzyme